MATALNVVPDLRRALPGTTLPPGQAKETWARGTAQSFEFVFLSTMLSPVFQSIPTDGPFGGGSGEEAWRGLLIERYADEMTRGGGVGIADAVYRQLMSVQEGTTP